MSTDPDEQGWGQGDAIAFRIQLQQGLANTWNHLHKSGIPVLLRGKPGTSRGVAILDYRVIPALARLWVTGEEFTNGYYSLADIVANE